MRAPWRACRVLLVAGAVFTVTARPAAAQAAARTDVYITIALGSGSLGFSGLVSGEVQHRNWVVMLRTTLNLPSAGEPVATDLGLLVGYGRIRRRVLMAVGAGVAVTETGDSSRTYGRPFGSHTGVGLPVQAELVWRPVRGIGFGAFGVANLNERRSFWSLQAGLQLGRTE